MLMNIHATSITKAERLKSKQSEKTIMLEPKKLSCEYRIDLAEIRLTCKKK